MKTAPYNLHWFRRDLRLWQNQLLLQNVKEFDGRVLGLFCFDPVFLAREDFSLNRFGFFLNTLAALKKELQAVGGDLLVLDEGPEKSFRKILNHCKTEKIPLPAQITWNRDYEPFARHRDEIVGAILKNEFGIHCQTDRDHLVVEPHEIEVESTKSFYKVFTPFKNKWAQCLATTEIQKRILPVVSKSATGPGPVFRMKWAEILGKSNAFKDQLENYRHSTLKQVTVSMPEAGSHAAQAALETFVKDHLDDYDITRDFPHKPGTSKLSLYLKNGSLTTAQIMGHLAHDTEAAKPLFSKSRTPSAAQKFLSQLVWREFYYHILYHRPEVEKTAFNPKYKNIPWDNNENYFQAWCQGRTGFPMIDAGMRQLNQTGWMHNRLRMIVASFLTKDLLIDWRWGEQYFMKLLLDGDLALNNGGWQWAASTGCDPQPYFRIFNPTLQGKRFDPDGQYIRKYIPELSQVEDKYIHEPWRSTRKGSYPAPIVDHSHQAFRAVAMFRAASADD